MQRVQYLCIYYYDYYRILSAQHNVISCIYASLLKVYLYTVSVRDIIVAAIVGLNNFITRRKLYARCPAAHNTADIECSVRSIYVPTPVCYVLYAL